MLSPKENYRNSFLHKATPYVPCALTDSAILGFGAHNGPWFEKGPEGGGYDGFGVRWLTPESGNNAAIPASDVYLLDDICDWREKVHIPMEELNAFDWEAYLKNDEHFENIDREKVLVEFGVGNGCFERLMSLLGFVEGLMALATDPEECCAFFDALTDYQIAYIRKIKEHVNPDIINYYDDVATERGLFMSPDTYRRLIKPYHKKVMDAIHEMGMFATYHCCGRAEDIVEDMIEIGADQWSSVQISNDIEALIQKYGDQITFSGGFDSNGPVALEGATPEMIQAEARRCVNSYGKYGKAYSLFGFFLNNDPAMVGRNFGILFGEFMPYRMSRISG
ncbi:MAG: hypothetical protein LUF78_08640 [Clostridiales bacterium]|nr:hypothetical protein [Clostridiales bacterium]